MFCFKIVAVLGMHLCDPNQLIATKQRNKLAAVNKALCYLTRGSFKEDQHTQASLTCVCLSLRLFVRTVWLDVTKIALKKQQRESEEEDAEAAIAEPEKDRSPAAANKFEGWCRIVDHRGSLLDPGRATADLARIRGCRRS